MKLPLADLHAALLSPELAVQRTAAPRALDWKLQWHRAAAGLAAVEPAARAPQTRRIDEARDLEACGAPTLAGQAPSPRANLVRPPAARTEERLPASPAREREPERAPVRLHIQALPAQGIVVWLGIDGDAALVAQRASAAVADLRRNLQATAGERIASIVCNGVAVYPRAPSPAAPPARIPPLFLKDVP